jgi:hypothetical protein
MNQHLWKTEKKLNGLCPVADDGGGSGGGGRKTIAA